MTECLSAQSCAQWLHYTAGDDARLCLDSRKLEAGDVFVILQAGNGIVGEFLGLDASETRFNEATGIMESGKTFSAAGYLFWISYNLGEIYSGEASREGVTSVSLEVLAVPEPAAIAALFGLSALLFAAFRAGRKRG